MSSLPLKFAFVRSPKAAKINVLVQLDAILDRSSDFQSTSLREQTQTGPRVARTMSGSERSLDLSTAQCHFSLVSTCLSLRQTSLPKSSASDCCQVKVRSRAAPRDCCICLCRV